MPVFVIVMWKKQAIHNILWTPSIHLAENTETRGTAGQNSPARPSQKMENKLFYFPLLSLIFWPACKRTHKGKVIWYKSHIIWALAAIITNNKQLNRNNLADAIYSPDPMTDMNCKHYITIRTKNQMLGWSRTSARSIFHASELWLYVYKK